MKKFNLYQRKNYGEFLSKIGVAVEIFEDWECSDRQDHGHDILEMSFIFRGTSRQNIDGVLSDVEAGTLTIVNYNQVHTVYTEHGSVGVANIYVDLEKVNFNGVPDDLRSIVRNVLPMHPVFGHDLNRLIQIKIDNPDEFTKLLKIMVSEQDRKEKGYLDIISGCFSLILTMIARNANEITRYNYRISESSYARLEKVLRYINDNIEKDITLDRLASVADINKYSLCREFKKATSKTLIEYVIERRIEKAMFDLRTTRKKIIDIALDCGFQDCSNFNRYFKKLLGVSPGDYRRGFGS